jgi:hypothetical protein
MRTLLTAACLLTLTSCTVPGDLGRYREVVYPNSSATCGENPKDGCGLTILDTSTGIVFQKASGGWNEYNPKTGEIVMHLDHF